MRRLWFLDRVSLSYSLNSKSPDSRLGYTGPICHWELPKTVNIVINEQQGLF